MFGKPSLYDICTMSIEIKTEEKRGSNVPEMSVSELAFSLKKTLEESYGRIRIRGELSGLKVAASGHLYGDIKDADANINIICWRGVLPRLSVKPEEGLDVIITGKVSSYPKSSRYQILIDTMELAGEGALLKMLEERKKKLAAEGLFAPERKKKIPFLPDVIGVVTSPTGAVIRDIMHRLSDRFPRHVLLYPVSVQGENAAEQVAYAIRAFDSLPVGGAVPRPDVLIVARGGGSLEDLMAFNEENVVRAVADCRIPVISAIGHETDTTLIDYAADRRAPTPTGAAEIAVPVRADLLAQTLDNEKRLVSALSRNLNEYRNRIQAQAARLGDPQKLLALQTQTLDHLGHKLDNGFERGLSQKATGVATFTARLRKPESLIREKGKTLSYTGEQLIRAAQSCYREKKVIYDNTSRMLETLSFKSILKRGFVVVRDENGKPVTRAAMIHTGQNIQLEFGDEKRVKAVINGKTPPSGTPKAPKPETAVNKGKSTQQGDLF